MIVIPTHQDSVNHWVIREATIADSERVARLVSELGYPTSTDQMRQRFNAILSDNGYETLVACDDKEILGFVGTRIGPLYEADEQYGHIMILAVATKHQRRGVGSMLMQAAESRLIKRGAGVLVVASGNHRGGAHAFYESLGYTFTGRRYKKSVADSR